MENTNSVIGTHAPDFELPGIDQSSGNQMVQVYHLGRYLAEERAVCAVFMSNQCPYVRQYMERLKQIQADFEGQGATLIGINPNDAAVDPKEDLERMKTFAAEQQLNFPYLRDANQDVARTFGASKTPEVFLLDKQGIICYHGAIDDNANNPTAVTTSYLRQALAEILAGQAISVSQTGVVGTPLKWRHSEH
ncbi:thioredoxin family protein [[Phormidium] sp. ETS-05]|uniref:thioredoxin family protein n=1 Tax=[Phormidium] sp. ETS-05 TaxID=222819 RepID=UPI0018EEE625|nr:thioredoxin family protein [[Phormidium] sp. ETS-05]